jgi:hypothetical protein
MSPIAKFAPNKEIEVALSVAEVVFKKKDGHFDAVPAGIVFSANHSVVASLTHEDKGSQSTLACHPEIAKELIGTKSFERIGLIFQEPQLKK